MGGISCAGAGFVQRRRGTEHDKEKTVARMRRRSRRLQSTRERKSNKGNDAELDLKQRRHAIRFFSQSEKTRTWSIENGVGKAKQNRVYRLGQTCMLREE